MLWVTPVYVYAVSNISMGFRIGVGVFESRGTVLYGVRVFYLPHFLSPQCYTRLTSSVEHCLFSNTN